VSYENAPCGTRRFHRDRPRRAGVRDPGDVSGDDAGFLAALQQVGIKYPSPDAAVRAGKSVCGCLNNGESGLELVHEVKTRNAGFTMEDASDFAMIAAKFYCPNNSPRADSKQPSGESRYRRPAVGMSAP